MSSPSRLRVGACVQSHGKTKVRGGPHISTICGLALCLVIHAPKVIGALIGFLVGLGAGLGAGLWIGFNYGLVYGIAGGAAAGIVTAVVVAKITNILAHALLKVAMVLSAVGFAVWAWIQYGP